MVECHVLYYHPCIKYELTGKVFATVSIRPEVNADSLKSFHQGSGFRLFFPGGKKHNVMTVHVYDY